MISSEISTCPFTTTALLKNGLFGKQLSKGIAPELSAKANMFLIDFSFGNVSKKSLISSIIVKYQFNPSQSFKIRILNSLKFSANEYFNKKLSAYPVAARLLK